MAADDRARGGDSRADRRQRAQAGCPRTSTRSVTMVGRAPRVLAYSHDGYGLGHIRRNLRVTRGLLAERPGLQVLAVTGCKVAHKFRYPPGVEYLKLPPVTKVSNDLYVADGLEIPGADVRSLRASLIAGAV